MNISYPKNLPSATNHTRFTLHTSKAGIMFFGANDPLHFRSVPVALLSLFRAATLEDWTDIMYISIFGCDKYTSGLYYVKASQVHLRNI